MKLQKKHLTLSLILLGILGIIALVVYTDKLSPEFIIAGIAYLLAMIQSKLFGEKAGNTTGQIEQQHREKRRKWQEHENEYDRRSEEIENKLNRAASEAKRLEHELDSVRGAGVRRSYTEDEILERLRKGGMEKSIERREGSVERGA
jgi:uncharacterized membrane protein YfhO